MCSSDLSTQTVSLSSCSKDIRSHKGFLQFSGVETEIELILARSGVFVKPVNFSEMTVCPLHRSTLGIGWRRASRLCSVPQDVSGHKKESEKVPAAERGISLQHSIHIFELTKNLVPVGSGKQLQCLFSLYARINICIASHFMQGTWRESQTSYHSKWLEPRSISSSYSVIVRMSVVLKRTVVGDSPTTVLFRTTLTQTITLYERLNILTSNHFTAT